MITSDNVIAVGKLVSFIAFGGGVCLVTVAAARIVHFLVTGKRPLETIENPALSERVLKERFEAEFPSMRRQMLLRSLGIGIPGGLFLGAGSAAMAAKDQIEVSNALMIGAVTGLLMVCVTLAGSFHTMDGFAKLMRKHK